MSLFIAVLGYQEGTVKANARQSDGRIFPEERRKTLILI